MTIFHSMKKLESGFFWFWIRKWRFSLLTMLIIIALGIFSTSIIPKESNPDIDFGIINVITVFQWVNPQDIDNLVTQKIEQEIQDIEWIKSIKSVSSVGLSNILIELDNGSDPTEILVNVKDAVDKVALPSEAEDPMVTEMSSDNELMFVVLLYWDEKEFPPLLLNNKAIKLKAELESSNKINRIDLWWNINESSKVSVWSAWDDDFYDIEVLVDKNKLEAMSISLLQISQTIKNRNTNQPLWNHTIWDLSYDFRIQWELEKISDIKDLPIQTENGYISLWDLSEIKIVLKDDSIKKLWSFNLSGQNYISLSFNKKSGWNLFKSASSAKRLLDQELQKIEYEWLTYKVISDLSDRISEDYNKLANNWLQTLLLVFFALLLFIGFKESLIATITIPLAFFITFIVLNALGLSLNFLTNFSLIITFGIAIDTTIVIIEWAYEKMRMWFNPKNAILLSVRDYKMPLIAWTSTTLVVFLPLLSLPGVLWKFLAYIPITIFVTLLAALLISLTINSALYYKLSKPKKEFEDGIIDTNYMILEDKNMLDQDRQWKIVHNPHNRSIREKALDHISKKYSEFLWKIMQNAKSRFFALSISLLLFILSIVFISPILGFELFPASDNGIINISISAKKWTTKEKMSTYQRILDKILSQQPEIKVYNYNIEWNIIKWTIEVVKKSDRLNNMRDIFKLEEDIKQQFSLLEHQWLEIIISVLKEWPSSEWAIGIKLVADTNKKFDLLLDVAKDFKDHLKHLTWAKNPSISSEESPWQFVFKFDRNKLTLLWLSPADINIKLFTVTNWIFAWSFKGENENLDIKVKYQQFNNEITPSDIENVNIAKINVWSILDHSFIWSVNQIYREDTKITVSVSSDTEKGIVPSDIQQQFLEFAKEYNYPDWVRFEQWWESQENAELIQSMMISFFIALILIFGILVLQFNSFVQPIIIMFSILMWLFWANIWLLVTWNPYSLMFMIWFIALTGIVINDAIIFLDRANKNVKRWMDRHNAITEAWQSRLQPIILTTITTIAGLSSILWDTMRQALAVTVMFGIFFGSIMTLFIVPAIYYDREKIVHIIKRVVFNPVLVVMLFVCVLAIFMIFWYLFQINFREYSIFMPILAILFWLYLIAYMIYSAIAFHKKWTTLIRKLLQLKMTNIDWKMITLKQSFKRLLMKFVLLFWPAWFAFVLLIMITLLRINASIFNIHIYMTTFSIQRVKTIMSTRWSSIFWIMWLTYFIILVYLLYQFWTTKNNQFISDKKNNIIILDKKN